MNVNNNKRLIVLFKKIENNIGNVLLDDIELSIIKEEAEQGTPRAEFDWGLIQIYCFNDVKNAQEWFDKCLKHMNGDGLLRCSGIFANMGDEWIDYSIKYLKRAAWRQNPIAKRMIIKMKECPFKYPEA